MEQRIFRKAEKTLKKADDAIADSQEIARRKLRTTSGWFRVRIFSDYSFRLDCLSTKINFFDNIDDVRTPALREWVKKTIADVQSDRIPETSFDILNKSAAGIIQPDLMWRYVCSSGAVFFVSMWDDEEKILIEGEGRPVKVHPFSDFNPPRSFHATAAGDIDYLEALIFIRQKFDHQKFYF